MSPKPFRGAIFGKWAAKNGHSVKLFDIDTRDTIVRLRAALPSEVRLVRCGHDSDSWIVNKVTFYLTFY